MTDGPEQPDALREQKQRAKAVLAASGVDVGATGGSQVHPDATRSPSAPTSAAARASPSRKRSRSGSPKSSQPPMEDSRETDGSSGKDLLLQRYISRDQCAALAVLDRDEQSVQTLEQLNDYVTLYKEEYGRARRQNPGSVFGMGYLGYGNGVTDIPPRQRQNFPGPVVQYPSHAKRPGNRRSRAHPLPPRDNMAAQAEQLEELVPLRLDIELDKIKLRDTFTWNLHDRLTDVGIFAENLVEDFKAPPEVKQQLVQEVARSIQEQIQNYYPHPHMEEEAIDPHLPYFAYKNDEMRILIKLHITIGQHTLSDQFEWDLNNPHNSPEDFAKQMALDLSLSGEFTTAIAHSIREQCQMFTKSLYITGHPFDGRPVEDTDISDNFLQSPMPVVLRPTQTLKDYQPYLWELSEAELERAELSIMREQRRQKRSVTRRGGPALPDLKDRQQTVRTLIVSSVLPGAAETIEESKLYKITRTKKSSGRAGRMGDDDSDESDSDESIPESPAPAQITGGTARTRGMRGAATVAQAAMRSALGRSQTPEIASLQEGRASSRSLRYEAREESVSEPTSLIVKLRISSAKLREFAQNPRAFVKPAATPVKPPTPQVSQAANAMPPPPSPAAAANANNGSAGTPAAAAVAASPRPQPSPSPAPSTERALPKYHEDGHVDAPYPQPAGAQLVRSHPHQFYIFQIH